MTMHNIFAFKFSEARPMSSAQYVNALFQHAASISSNASPEDLQTLEAIATNTKAAHEHHLQTSNAELTRQLEEKEAELVKLRALSSNNNNNNVTVNYQDLFQQLQAKDHELAQWDQHFKDRLNEKICELVNRLNFQIRENEELRVLFKKAVQNEVEKQVGEKVKERTKGLSHELEKKDEEIVRLHDLLKHGNPETKEYYRRLTTSVFHKNEEIKVLRAERDNLRRFRDKYDARLEEIENEENCEPLSIEELKEQIVKLRAKEDKMAEEIHEQRIEIQSYRTNLEDVKRKMTYSDDLKQQRLDELIENNRELSDEKCKVVQKFKSFEDEAYRKIDSLNADIENLKRSTQRSWSRNY